MKFKNWKLSVTLASLILPGQLIFAQIHADPSTFQSITNGTNNLDSNIILERFHKDVQDVANIEKNLNNFLGPMLQAGNLTNVDTDKLSTLIGQYADAAFKAANNIHDLRTVVNPPHNTVKPLDEKKKADLAKDCQLMAKSAELLVLKESADLFISNPNPAIKFKGTDLLALRNKFRKSVLAALYSIQDPAGKTFEDWIEKP